jgi:Leucine-rich repeat (LRR) protein
MQVNEGIERLQYILSQEPDSDIWEELIECLDNWQDYASLSAAVDYAEQQLADWPDYLRTPPTRQWEAIQDGAPLPRWWILVRHIKLGEDDNILDPFPVEGLENITSITLEKDICLSAEELNLLGTVSKLGALRWYNLIESLEELSEDEAIDEILDAAEQQLTNLPDEKRTVPTEYWQEIREGTTPLPRWWKLVRHIKLAEDNNFIDPFPMEYFNNLTSLDVGERRYLVPEELDVIAQFTQLQSLNLSYQEFLVYLQPLTKLTQLVSLTLIGCSLTDLSGIGELSNLEDLDLSSCYELTNIEPLAALKSLSLLNLEECIELTDLTPLSQLTTLRYLKLSDCTSITDVSPLAGLNQLELLELIGCDALSDLMPLANLVGLTVLQLGGDSITNLPPLANLRQLESLYLIKCSALTNLSPLQELKNLTELMIKGCDGLTDLSPLAALSELTSLSLIECGALTNISPLAGLTNLTTLNLRGCDAITDLSPLAALRNCDIYR